MSLKPGDLVILEGLSEQEWREIPMHEMLKYGPADRPRFVERGIKGRRPQVRRLMDLGYLHVRTSTRQRWYSAHSDPRLEYRAIVVEAILTAQGNDIRSITEGINT